MANKDTSKFKELLNQSSNGPKKNPVVLHRRTYRSWAIAYDDRDKW